MAINIIQHIIRKNVSNQIIFNIIDLEDLKNMWDKLKSIYINISQGIIYSILQKLFNYPKINNLKRYNKLVM